MAVFALSSFWAAYAGSPGELIAARGVMGVGSALAVPAAMAIVTFTFTGQARASAFGLFSVSAGVGLAAGPVLGGVLLAHFWWGSVFLVNVPIVAVAMTGVLAVVPNVRSPQRRRIDPAGLILSVAGLGVLAYGLIRAGQVAAWDRLDVAAPIAVGIVLLAIFTIVELRLRQPSFDPRLMARRVFGGGNAGLGLLFLAMTAATFFFAFYLQGARGFSPLKSALTSLPAAVGVMLGAQLGTRLVARFSVRPVTVTGLTIAALALGSWSLFGLHTPIVWNMVLSLVQGTAIGTVIAPVTSAVMSTLPLDRAGAGSAVNNTIRQTGSLLGIAAGGTIMAIVYRRGMAGAPPQAKISAERARQLAAVTHRPDLAAAADHAFIHAMHITALWTAGIALAGAAVLAFALRPAPAEAPAPTPVDTENTGNEEVVNRV
jgi:MFS family permease